MNTASHRSPSHNSLHQPTPPIFLPHHPGGSELDPQSFNHRHQNIFHQDEPPGSDQQATSAKKFSSQVAAVGMASSSDMNKFYMSSLLNLNHHHHQQSQSHTLHDDQGKPRCREKK